MGVKVWDLTNFGQFSGQKTTLDIANFWPRIQALGLTRDAFLIYEAIKLLIIYQQQNYQALNLLKV